MMKRKYIIWIAVVISLILCNVAICGGFFYLISISDSEFSIQNMGEQLLNLPDLEPKLVDKYTNARLSWKFQTAIYF